MKGSIFSVRNTSAVKGLYHYTSKIQTLTRLSCYALMILSVSHQEKQMPAYAVACFSFACDKPKFIQQQLVRLGMSNI